MDDVGLEIDGLVSRFGRPTAVDGVSLAAHRGHVLGLLGPNGAGKTTVVRVSATLPRPAERDLGGGRRRPRPALVGRPVRHCRPLAVRAYGRQE
ncbi:ATP-binding cassette domain-containing protein [Streptomyces smyrnaeus]|uniref:ATP-binding cassette domain-containing protein n=1 Tax=Streptomyces smyrnaeus TaxID=1387713 RepID=UPI003F4C7FE1